MNIKKITQSMNKTISEQKNRSQPEDEIKGTENNMPEGYRINEFGEISSPDWKYENENFMDYKFVIE